MTKLSLKRLWEETKFVADEPTSLAHFLAGKFKQNPQAFADNFFGEPQLIKQWRTTYTGKRILPSPGGKFGSKQTWTKEKDDSGNLTAKRQMYPDVPYAKKEPNDYQKELGLLRGFKHSRVKTKDGQVYFIGDETDIQGSKSGKPLSVLGYPVVKVDKDEPRELGNFKKDEKIDWEHPKWISKDEIEFEPTFRGWDQDFVPPESVLLRLTMPDDKFEKFKNWILEHFKDPDPEYFQFKKTPAAVPDQKEKPEKDPKAAEFEKIENFLTRMTDMEPHGRVKYLFNMITFASGTQARRKETNPADRAGLKAVNKEKPNFDEPKHYGLRGNPVKKVTKGEKYQSGSGKKKGSRRV